MATGRHRPHFQVALSLRPTEFPLNCLLTDYLRRLHRRASRLAGHRRRYAL